jgi:hypothetical protein
LEIIIITATAAKDTIGTDVYVKSHRSKIREVNTSASRVTKILAISRFFRYTISEIGCFLFRIGEKAKIMSPDKSVSTIAGIVD